MRRKKYTELDGGNKKNQRRFLSNATHLSNTDPDAKIAKKSGKPRMLCYSSMMGVDAESHVITHIAAEHASKKDSRYLLDTVEPVFETLQQYYPSLAFDVRNERTVCASDLVTRRFEHHKHTHRYG